MTQAVHIFIESFEFAVTLTTSWAAVISSPQSVVPGDDWEPVDTKEESQGDKKQLVHAEVKGEGHGCLSGSRHGVKRGGHGVTETHAKQEQ